MTEQYSFFDVQPPSKPKADSTKRNWEDGFQRWSNREAQNELDPLGICGFGSMCGYCEDNTFGRPCVRALNAMCKAENITIDYTNRNYEDIWNGVFE